MKVRFEDEGHKYLYGDKRYKSVSELFKTLDSDPFNGEITSGICAAKAIDLRLYESIKKDIGGYKPEEILEKFPKTELFHQRKRSFLDKWEADAQKGTDFHLIKEKEDIARGYCINSYDKKKYTTQILHTKYDNEAFAENLWDIPDGYFTEFLAFNHETESAGQLDKLFVETVKGKRYFDIDDWKTDKEIVEKPAYPFNKKLLFPFDQMYNCNYSKYSVKINVYAWMLAEAGFIPRDLRFTHVELDEELEIKKQTPYRIQYREIETKIFMEKFG